MFYGWIFSAYHISLSIQKQSALRDISNIILTLRRKNSESQVWAGPVAQQLVLVHWEPDRTWPATVQIPAPVS